MVKKYFWQKLKNLFEIAFERPKIAFNTQKNPFEEKVVVGKKVKSAFKGSKSLKMTKKNTFGKSLKLKLLPRSYFFT
jgi:hypothetical protein